MERPTVYIETSVISYMVARPSRDIVILAHQQLTVEWWREGLPKADAFVSAVVLEEVSKGDSAYAQRRLDLVSGFPSLDLTPEVEELANEYMRAGSFPKQGMADCMHLALASWHEIESLVTWNCAHISSVQTKRLLERINRGWDIPVPVICSPEEHLA